MTKNDAFAQRMVPFALDRGWKPNEEDLAPFMERMVNDLERSVRIIVDGQSWTGERIKGLCEAIWPGKPQWTPTAEKPQQDFYEAVVESLRFPTEDDTTPESDSTASTTHDNPKSDKLTSCPTDLD
jgi:hypothetical protein